MCSVFCKSRECVVTGHGTEKLAPTLNMSELNYEYLPALIIIQQVLE